MTTIGVTPAHSQRVLSVDVPSYVYSYPSTKNVQLAAVKTGLYHPKLPTFRRMDMDTAGHKLPDQHCRTTTSAGPDYQTPLSVYQEDFRRATSTLFTPPERKLNTAQCTATGRELHNHYTAPEELKQTRLEWSNFLNRSPERFNVRLPELPENKDLHFSGYAVRYMRPEVTASWKYTLRQEPSLDQYSQKPIPANVFARYRDTYPQYNRNIATEAWRS